MVLTLLHCLHELAHRIEDGNLLTRIPAMQSPSPPAIVAEVKALVCQLPATVGVPLSRFSRRELRRHVLEQGIVAEISGTTIWRWLSQDAIRPRSHRSWVFRRGPDFARKAGRVLDLYQGLWDDNPLGENDFVLSAEQYAAPRHLPCSIRSEAVSKISQRAPRPAG